MILLSIVIPTKNEERNIGACLAAFAPFEGEVELIVVDNFSSDATRRIAAEKGARVLECGPERCAQRNFGWRAARGEFVMFVDADMIVPDETIREIVSLLPSCDALYVREVRVGRSFRIRARNFERSFYDGTVIDALRVVRRDLLEKTGGYDEGLIACEDWDLDRRLLALGARTAQTMHALCHNEAQQSLAVLLRKKAYYSASVAAYRRKWGDDPRCRHQLGFAHRYFGVFLEKGKWRKLFSHPVLALVMYFERIAVGLTYLVKR